MACPARICICYQQVGRIENGARGMDALDIVVRITTDLELEFGIALGCITFNFPRHFPGTFLTDCPVKCDIILCCATKQIIYGLTCDLAEQIPAGDIDRGLGIGMAA